MPFPKLFSAALAGLAISQGFAQLPAAFSPPRAHLSALYHVGFWVKDIEKSRAFYGNYLGLAEPYVLNYPTGALQMVALEIREGESVFLFPGAAKILPNGDNLANLGLVTDDVAALHDQLAANGVKATAARRARQGNRYFVIKDLDGHAFEITQFEPDVPGVKKPGRGRLAPPLATRLRSATITVADLAAAATYYRDKLGFKEIRRGHDGKGEQIELRVPEGRSCIVLRHDRVEPATGAARAMPEFCLEVLDVGRTFALLNQRASAGGFPPPSPVEIRPDGARQTSCVDPDGTRVVLLEVER
jgi:catechol 2,3-dioxygenase-like lactoylglutathione lyase family enzyme